MVKRNGKFGFTMIELLMSLGIMVIVIGLGMSLINPVAQLRRARDTKRKGELDQIKKALRLYYNDYRYYPTASAGQIVGCGAAGNIVCAWGGVFGNSATESYYMKLLPDDPTGTVEYSYSRVSIDDFCLVATLENSADSDLARAASRCPSCSVSGLQYVVCAD